jgi:hypothetical protein
MFRDVTKGEFRAFLNTCPCETSAQDEATGTILFTYSDWSGFLLAIATYPANATPTYRVRS